MASQLLCFLVLLTLTTICKSKSCHPNDLKGLQDFKSGIHSDTSGRLSKWIGRNCCKWEGIFCSNVTKRVVSISLPGLYTSDDAPIQSAMEGELSPSITLINYLEVINIGDLLGITGKIPSSIGLHLPNLRKLNFVRNRFTGALPESICMLSKLEELYLQENGFSGFIPWCIGGVKNLRRMDVHSNKLSGVIPESITKLKKLESLCLEENFLTGDIPENIGNLQELKEVDLSNNSLTGIIPRSISRLKFMSVLYLNSNQLEGDIPLPSKPGKLSSLSFVRLQNNQLSGTIPSSIGYLTSLQRVSLANNQLKGSIPSSIGNLKLLEMLYLSCNQLSGQLPRSIGGISELIYLSISHNMIEGPLPREISSLSNLQSLDLSFNRLNMSTIPKWLMQLPSLSQIYLAGCEIHGEIPDYIPKSLLELDLSANHLSGRIPAWIGSFSQIYSLNLSKNKFVSEIPSTVTNLDILGVLDLHSNKLDGSVNAVFQIKSRFAEGSLTYLDLSDNNFSSGVEQIGMGGQQHIQHLNLSHNFLKGRLPTSVGTLKTLQTLDLSYNGLGANLPTSLANVTVLERLMLHKNQFTGRIPEEFLKLNKLKELNLSDNLLEGKIPYGKPFLDFPQSSFSGNRGLCGKPLLPCKS
ncbi:LRR receptor-like serine/threonine-protein kinase GSO1 [Solanum tuberosum]|uniref:Serine-threonine protein kinase, plant-type n=1 Tax=Solanum tuberosum TaxID=4113 RepID=M1C291_SOLTU|nr:PREDICTED: LRR receptor-like serine/threonine-protein kinase GSO1 [Solanum tuberosum]